ncbi:MAG: M23 family metallopeptidase [Desulfohalobiaceae bacterium]|nr:M23 family metallopeptidase [Desulfohalobiaceae bacterium]
MFFADKQEPQITLMPESKYINEDAIAEIDLQDSLSGLAEVNIVAVQGETEKTLLSHTMEQSPAHWSTTLQVKEMGLQEGPFQLRVIAEDNSWFRYLQGNRASAEQSYVLDTTPPRIRLESFRHNMSRGGSGAVAFRIDEEEKERAGVSVGEAFFPAYHQEKDIYLAFFAYPYNLRAGQGRPVVTVQDRAGNKAKSSLRCSVTPRRQPTKRLRITDRFLDRTMPGFRDAFPGIQDKLELFLAVNGKLRRKNRAKLREIGNHTVSRPLWSGRFLRQPNAAKQSSYAVRRNYYYQSEQISQATHLGIDLASVARARIPAANSGRIVYADRLGIYGQTVIIDHGLGLQSLYGHMSQIGVSEGQSVDKGEIIGRTGATGLAGGDHLHFEMLISGMPVTPVEWWDAKWIENNIVPKLEQAREAAAD